MRAVLALSLLAATPAAGSAASLCDSLAVPDGYALTCETRVEGGARSERAVVRPGAGAGGGPGLAATLAASVAELTVQPLTREAAPLAWTEPSRWLEEQVALDVDGLASALRALGSAGPLAHPAAKATLDGLAVALAGWGRLPLQACAEDAARPGRRELRCQLGAVPPLAAGLTVRLAEAGDARYAVRWWAADEQRLRHLEAIANSFSPPGAPAQPPPPG